MGLVNAIRNGLTPKRSIENPSTPLSADDHWMLDHIGGKSETGIQVNRVSAMGHSAVWRAVNLIAGDVSRIPLVLHRRLPDGSSVRATDHRLYELIKEKPNPETTANVFFRTITGHVLLQGNGYAVRERGKSYLWMLDPSLVTPVRMNGKLWYVYQPATGKQVRFKPADMLHIRGLGWDGLQGYSPLSMLKDTIGEGIAQRSYGSRFFSNNSRPNVVLEYPGQLKSGQVRGILDAWERMAKGLDSAHKTAILQRGMIAKPLSINARDAQLIEARQLNVQDIANIFGVNPAKLGDRKSVSYNSLEQEDKAYLAEALDPVLTAWESEANDKLLSPQARKSGLFFEFVREAIIKTDIRTETDVLVTEVNNGLLSLDEARKIKNRPSLPDGLGEGFRIPQNIGEIGAEESEPQPKPPPSPPGDDESEESERVRRLFDSVYERIAKRLEKSKDRSVDKHLAPVSAQLEPIFEFIDAELQVKVEAEKLIRLAAAGGDVRRAVDDVL